MVYNIKKQMRDKIRKNVYMLDATIFQLKVLVVAFLFPFLISPFLYCSTSSSPNIALALLFLYVVDNKISTVTKIVETRSDDKKKKDKFI